MTNTDQPNGDPAPEAASNAPRDPVTSSESPATVEQPAPRVYDATGSSQFGLDLSELVQQFRNGTSYPTEDDEEQKRLRKEWAEKLAEDNITRLSRTDLLAYTNNAVGYGSYVDRREHLKQKWITDLDDAQFDRLLDNIRDLCWGEDELSIRIDRLVDSSGVHRKDTGTPGFSGTQVSRTLAICLFQHFLPCPSPTGKWGRRSMLRALGLPDPRGSTYGQKLVDAHDRLREHLAPHFDNDTLGIAVFLYWLRQKTLEDSTRSAWMFRGGRDGEFEERAIEEGIACIGWSQLPDLRDVDSKEQMAVLLDEATLRMSPGAVNAWVGQLWRLKTDIHRGDVVAMPMKTTSQIALGVVSQEYSYRENVGADAPPHVLSVDWKRTDVPRSALADDLRASLGSQLTICALGARDAAWRLQQVIETGIDPGPREHPDPREADGPEDLDQLAERLLIDTKFLQDIVELLEDKGQVILYGPPGTGKTYLARELARALAPEESCRMLVQFHPSTSYEDFFEGYRPAGTGDDGGIRYELTPGPLARMAQRAAASPDDQHVMIIDEINRGNLPRVLGELLFLLEYRDESVQTLYRPEEPFSLPDNLWFIGTMNTADRSIALVDAALRRRFHFVPFFPDSGPMAGLLDRWLAREEEPAWIGHLVNKVNGELKKELEGSHLLLGPSHFMKKYGSSPDEQRERLRRIWEYNIEPFIEDQFFGDPDRIGHFRFNAVMGRHGPSAMSDDDAGDDSGDPAIPDGDLAAEDVDAGSGERTLT